MAEIRANVTDSQKDYVKKLVEDGEIKSESEFVRYKIREDKRYYGGDKK